ncbi:hypothetical protein [Sporosarcina sp. NPDC096371]|uniref:hypothetical protein n=1 Tax=Sporosarcina sp. NPDC096371 TaxID=3364530 RepID=UPI00382145C5
MKGIAENSLDSVYLMLGDLQVTIEENDIAITISLEAKQALVKLGYDKRFGAGPLSRVIQDKIEDPLTDLVLEENIGKVHVGVEDEEIVVRKV